MIIKILFIILVIFIMKLFIIRFDYKDYYNITISMLFILFSYLYIMNNNLFFLISIILLGLSLVIYSLYKQDSSDSSIVFINGNINFKNMIKNNYSLLNLVKDLKKNKLLYINDDICGVLVDKKLVFYSKESHINRPVNIVVDGRIYNKELMLIGKSRKWLERKIKDNDCLLNDIFYAFYYKDKFYIIKK